MRTNYSAANALGKSCTFFFRQTRTFLVVIILVIGNMLLSGLFHLIPQGGMIFHPIYFFTLFGAYKYGLKAGILTAVLSPVVSYLLTGMPSVDILLIILTKSCLLALAASYGAKCSMNISLLTFVFIVLFYQMAGVFIEWGTSGNILLAFRHLYLAIPGMIFHIFGVYGMLKLITKYRF
ncbi:MAG: ECF transporter S component [Candidatus Azobacteroides sp.]|nr:ECF transporter S component [Candidatus Azobacteroides sp.]